MCGNDSGTSSPSNPWDANPDEEATKTALANAPLGTVVARHASGRGRFVLGAQEAKARGTLRASSNVVSKVELVRHAALLGLTEAAAKSVSLASSQASSDGAQVVQFKQEMGGIPVFRARASVLLDSAKHLVALTSNLSPAAGGKKAMSFAATAATEAPKSIARVVSVHVGVPITEGSVVDLGARAGSSGSEAHDYRVPTPAGVTRVFDVTASRVLFPEENALVPAYHVQFVARAPGSRMNDGYEYVADAETGRILHKASLTAHERFTYKVWADQVQNHIPLDGPYQRSVPYAGEPQPGGGPEPDFVPPIDVEMEGFNHHGQSPDPWLPANATVTHGNNVHAYSDRNDTHAEGDVHHPPGDGFDPGVDLEGTTTSARRFDRTFDPLKEPNASPDQIKASVTQLFYVTNWMHDYWYDSGFDEAAGNAQSDNFGRGGKGGDPILVESQDGAEFGQVNNANMTTYADGTSPRMQMFQWGRTIHRAFETSPPVVFREGWGATVTFGAQSFALDRGEAVLANDGTPDPTATCQPPVNVQGKIALVELAKPPAACSLVTRLRNTKRAGAVGALFALPAPGAWDLPLIVTDAEKADLANFPILVLGQKDGAALKAKLAGGAGVHVLRMFRGDEGPMHDGSIDNGLVAHEWAHYMHHRLVPVCSSLSCRGMSEGWGDFNALFLSVREGDSFDGTVWPSMQYASAGNTTAGSLYFGIRRAPYSTNMMRNPFTFDHVRQRAQLPSQDGIKLAAADADMSEAHNSGEVWAQSLFEAYANVQQATPGTFEAKKRRFANYLVNGMKMAPAEPTFTEQRDTILAAVLSSSEDARQADFEAIAKGFQKRGLGVDAVAPPTFSMTLNEAVANFDYGGKLEVESITVDDSTQSCNHNGHLDAGESGKITVRVRNAGWIALSGTKLTVTSGDPYVVVRDGSSSIDGMNPLLDTRTFTYDVAVSADAPKRAILPITVTLENDQAVTKKVEATYAARYNYSVLPNSSASDDVESDVGAWSFDHGEGGPYNAWERKEEASNHFWHGKAVETLSIADTSKTTLDERLVSPELAVGGTEPFRMTFRHRHSFRTLLTATGVVSVDGGVIEISSDGGTTWIDIEQLGVNPKYTGKLGPDVPLGNREAFVDQSAGYPAFESMSYDFGHRFANQRIQVRFRENTILGGTPGWDIDDIAFGGITNTPFATLADATCEASGSPDGGGNNANPPASSGSSDGGCSVSASPGSGTRAGAWGFVALGIALGLMRRRRAAASGKCAVPIMDARQ